MMQENNIENNLKHIVTNTLSHYHFKVHNAYNMRNFPHWNIAERKISDWMLVYARDGKGYYSIDGIKHPIEEGKIFFISNDITHSAGQDEMFPASVIAIRMGLYDNISHKPVIGTLPPIGFSFRINRYSYYQQLFENIYTYFKLYEEELSMSLCNTLLCQIFNSIYLSILKKSNLSGSHNRIQKARLYIEENILENLPLNKVASHAELSPKYFSRLFKEQYNLTYKQFLFEAKMNYARLLLEETDYSIKKVALLLGYSDQYIFSNQFKKIYKFPPSKVR